MEAFDYGHTIVQILAWTAVQMAAGAVVGRLLRRPWLEGQAIGLLVLIGASDLALYVARAAHLGHPLFAALAFAFTGLLTVAMRWAAFPVAPPVDRRADCLALPLALGLCALVLAVRLMTPDPQAGYVIYQAWNPLYLDSSLRAGFFLRPEDTFMGPGFITTGQIAYPPDALGLAALCHWLAGGAHPAYFASTTNAVLACIGLLVHSLRRSRTGLLVFAVLLLVFLRYGNSFRLLALDNWIDVTLFLAGTLTTYYLVAGENRRVARLGAGFASIFMVFARPYGALYSALILVLLFAIEMRDPATRCHFRYWCVCATVSVACTARELVLVALNGLYYARPTTLEVVPPSLAKSALGTLFDWGLLPHESHFALSFPKGLPMVVALVVLVAGYRRGLLRRPDRLLPYLAPLLLLVAPLVAELLTGFRKGPFSKLYVVALFLFPWYPAFLLSRLPARPVWLRASEPWAGRLAWAGLAAGAVVALALAVGPTADWTRAKFDRVVWSYRANNSDLMIARSLAERLGDGVGAVAARKVLYVHTEPGIGLRYFLGGDLFADYDFWSERVQAERMRAKDLPELLRALGCPSVYVSYPGWRMMGLFVPYDGWEPFGDQIDALEGSAMVSATITDGSAKFHVTRCP